MGITSGIVAASATAGALVGFGIRLGTPALAFNATSAIVLGQRALALHGAGGLPTAVGGLVHVAAMLACGLAYVSLVTLTRGHAISWAVFVSAAATAMSWFVARQFGVGPAAVLPLGNLLMLGVVLVGALMVGMRLAPVEVYRD